MVATVTVGKLVARWQTISRLYGAPDAIRDAIYQQCADELKIALRQEGQAGVSAEAVAKLVEARIAELRAAEKYTRELNARLAAGETVTMQVGVGGQIGELAFLEKLEAAFRQESQYICPKCRKAVPENALCPYCALAIAPPEQAEVDLKSFNRGFSAARTNLESLARSAVSKGWTAEELVKLLFESPFDPPQAVSAGALVERITAYVSLGGLFNPEMAEHVHVRDLLIACREVLLQLAAHDQKVRAEVLEEIASQHSLYPGAITIMCSCGKAFNHIAFVAAEEWKTHIRSLASGAVEKKP